MPYALRVVAELRERRRCDAEVREVLRKHRDDASAFAAAALFRLKRGEWHMMPGIVDALCIAVQRVAKAWATTYEPLIAAAKTWAALPEEARAELRRWMMVEGDGVLRAGLRQRAISVLDAAAKVRP